MGLVIRGPFLYAENPRSQHVPSLLHKTSRGDMSLAGVYLLW